MSEQTEDELDTEILGWAAGLQQKVEALAQQAKRWSGVCPVCKSSLDPADPASAGHRPPMVITHQMQSNLCQLTGQCGECYLSPAEVEDSEISQWVWVRLPDDLMQETDQLGMTVRASGTTVLETIRDLEKKHPGLEAPLVAATSATYPEPFLELSVNWVPASELFGLETPVKGGDYVKFPSLALAE